MKTFQAQFFDLVGYEPTPYELTLFRGHSLKEVMEQQEVPDNWLLSDEYNKVLFVSYLIGNSIKPDEIKYIHYEYIFIFCVIAALKDDNQLITNIIRLYQNPGIAMVIDHLNNKVKSKMNSEHVNEFFALSKTWCLFSDHDYSMIVNFLDSVFETMYEDIIIGSNLHQFNHNPKEALCYNVISSRVKCVTGFWLLLCYIALLLAVTLAFIINHV